MKIFKTKLSINLLLFLLTIVAIVFILTYNTNHNFDEPFFIRNSHLFSKFGLSKDFLTGMRLQAPGPTYQIFHYFFSAFTGYNIIWMRITTVISLLACFFLTKRIIESENQLTKVDFWTIGLLFFMIPTTWVFGTMAITQTPAMLFALGFIFLFDRKPTFIYSIILGLLLALAILGRAHYGALFLYCLVDVLRTFNRETLMKNLLIFATVSTICLPIFIVWGGYVPPDQQAIFSNSSKLHFSSASAGFIYLFIFTTILTPKWIVKPKSYFFVLIFIVSLLLNYYFEEFRYQSKSISILFSVFPEKFISLVPVPLFFTIALFTIYHYLDFNAIVGLKTAGILGLIIIATCLSGLRSTGFGDGYIYQVLPLIILYNYSELDSKFFTPRYIILGSIGFIYLLHRMAII